MFFPSRELHNFKIFKFYQLLNFVKILFLLDKYHTILYRDKKVNFAYYTFRIYLLKEVEQSTTRQIKHIANYLI